MTYKIAEHIEMLTSVHEEVDYHLGYKQCECNIEPRQIACDNCKSLSYVQNWIELINDLEYTSKVQLNYLVNSLTHAIDNPKKKEHVEVLAEIRTVLLDLINEILNIESNYENFIDDDEAILKNSKLSDYANTLSSYVDFLYANNY